MPEPVRSPKQSRASAKSRTHPYARPITSHRTARDAGLQRSSSLLGTIKSIVTAPLAWLSSGDTQEQFNHVSEDSSQKRKAAFTERSGTPPRAKRLRRDSPDEKEEDLTRGYLDPPSTLFASRKRLHIPLWDVANGVPPVRSMTVDQQSTDGLPPPPARVRSHSSMSIEPQNFFSARRSTTREQSMPLPSPFGRSFSRVSLTPQPAGATFGPSPKRKSRNTTAPPLIPVPIPPVPTFTHPSSSTLVPQNLFRRQASRDLSEGPIMSLLSQTKQSMTPIRESSTSTMLIGTNMPLQRTPSKAASQAERTLASLESYRTPLTNPSFPSQPYPEDLRPRKVHVPLPSKFGFDHGPEGVKKKRPSFVGPYSTEMSGMRKLLQKRKQELLEEEQRGGEMEGKNEQSAESDTYGKHEARSIMHQQDEISMKAEKGGAIEQVTPKTDVRSSKADSYLGLRAPNSRVSRSHIPAPQLKRHRNKYSLNDDDDDDVPMSVEDLKNYQATMQADLASNRRMSEAGMQTDTSMTPEAPPPLPTPPQSFDSLLSRMGPPVPSSKPAAEFPPLKVDSEIQADPLPKLSTNGSSAPATLPFSFGTSPVTPAIPKSVDGVPSPFAFSSSMPPTSVPTISTPAPVGVPSFFANTKVQFTPPSIPTGPLFAAPSASSGVELEKPTLNVFGAQAPSEKQDTPAEMEKKPEEANKPSHFGGFSQPSSSEFGDIGVTSASTAATPFSGFTPNATSEALKPAFPLNAEAPKSLSIFGAAKTESASTEAATRPTFSFDASSAAAPSASTEKPQVTPSFSFGAAPATGTNADKPNLSFGQSKPEQEASTLSPTPASFTFNATPSTPPPAALEKKTFTFGVTSSFGSNDAPKPAFGGFGSVVTTPVPSTPYNGDSMEMGDRMEESPTRNVDKKDSATMSLPFETSSGNDANTSFSFAQKATVPTPASSPFAFGQPAKSSPAGFGGFSSQNTEASTTGNGLSFGTKPSDQSSFGSSNNIPFGTSVSAPAFTFGGTKSTSGITSFGQSTNNGATSLFGQPTNSGSTTPTPFGQLKQDTSAGNSAPNSPSLFPQATLTSSPSFAFSVPASTSLNGFSAPKADGAAPSTPNTSQPFQFGAGATSGSQQPQGSQSAGNMFNIGAAASTPTRKVKGLPTRRAKRS